MPTIVDSMTPSSHRPLPLRMREDLVIKQIVYQAKGSWVIKDPAGLKYHRLNHQQHLVLTSLDGTKSLEDLKHIVQKDFPTAHFKLTDIQFLITDLYKKNLLISDRPGQAVSLLKQEKQGKKKKLFSLFTNILYLRLPGWDPERTLVWLYPKMKWIFHPWVVFISVAFVLSASLLVLVQFEQFTNKLPEFHQFFGWPNLIYLWVSIGLAKIIHEFGHGLTCKHYGKECHEMGVMLLVFSPCMYCDVTDSWMLKNKWQRILIGAAGMYIEILISAFALYFWWFSQPGLFHFLSLNVFFITTISTVIFNANPLMRFDGYYMMSDFLEIPNLRAKSDKLLADTFAWYCLGIHQKKDPFEPESGRFWFVLYAISAAFYRWFIIFGITLFLYTVLKPYRLQSIGATMAVISLASIGFGLIYKVYQILAAPRSEPLSIPKIVFSLTLLTGLVAGGLMIPLPLHFESAFLLEPENVQHIYTLTPGRLVEMNVKPGDHVEEGDLIARLKNEELEDEKQQLELQARIQITKIHTFQSLSDSAQEDLAREKLKGIEDQITEHEKLLKHLEIRAPVSGKVVPPPVRPEPKLDVVNRNLNQWYGTPLDESNRFCLLEEKTHLLSIAPNENYQAVLLVEQKDRSELKLNQDVELKFKHIPDKTFQGKISEISERTLDYAPESLSNKLGGELATFTDDQGRERLMTPAYQSMVLVEEEADLLRTGMRGQARFSVDTKTAGEWLWLYFRRTFHFRL